MKVLTLCLLELWKHWSNQTLKGITGIAIAAPFLCRLLTKGLEERRKRRERSGWFFRPRIVKLDMPFAINLTSFGFTGLEVSSMNFPPAVAVLNAHLGIVVIVGAAPLPF